MLNHSFKYLEMQTRPRKVRIAGIPPGPESKSPSLPTGKRVCYVLAKLSQGSGTESSLKTSAKAELKWKELIKCAVIIFWIVTISRGLVRLHLTYSYTALNISEWRHKGNGEREPREEPVAEAWESCFPAQALKPQVTQLTADGLNLQDGSIQLAVSPAGDK